jgi:hypothetical protein
MAGGGVMMMPVTHGEPFTFTEDDVEMDDDDLRVKR